MKGGASSEEIEEKLFLNYINEYELFDYLFLTMQDLFFNPQVPNPIPIISQKMEYQSYKFQLKEIPSDRVIKKNSIIIVLAKIIAERANTRSTIRV